MPEKRFELSRFSIRRKYFSSAEGYMPQIELRNEGNHNIKLYVLSCNFNKNVVLQFSRNEFDVPAQSGITVPYSFSLESIEDTEVDFEFEYRFAELHNNQISIRKNFVLTFRFTKIKGISVRLGLTDLFKSSAKLSENPLGPPQLPAEANPAPPT